MKDFGVFLFKADLFYRYHFSSRTWLLRFKLASTTGEPSHMFFINIVCFITFFQATIAFDGWLTYSTLGLMP